MKQLFYYYLRTDLHNRTGEIIDKRKPFGCVCLGYDPKQGVWSRGVSLCSQKENFIKKEGRKRARARCLKAMGTNSNSEKINYIRDDINDNKPQIYWLENSFKAPWKFIYKSEHNINLTDYEYEIVKDEKFNENHDQKQPHKD